jgi:histone deacetylase 1/2
MQLHGSFQELRQHDDSASTYLQKAKALFDELVAAGRPISLAEFNLYVFRGLRSEFKDLVTSLSTKADPISYTDLHSSLLTHEFLHKAALQPAVTAPLLPTPSQQPAAFFVQNHLGFNNARRGRFRGGWRNNNNRNNAYRGNNGNNNYISGQQFGQQGHRFSSGQFSGSPSRPSGQFGQQGNRFVGYNRSVKCQLCYEYGHTAQQCTQLANHPLQANVNLAFNTAPATFPVTWFPYTGANHHITPDIVGDGKGLVISNIAHSKIHSPKRTFTLSNILHVPAIKKPLLSVQKFSLENNVFFEFHSCLFYIKDLMTKKVLLSGQSKDGLYVLSESSAMSLSQAFSSTCLSTSADIWHRRLGHPSPRILHLLVKNKKVSCTTKCFNFNCPVCPLGKSCRLTLKTTGHQTLAPLDLIFSDVWGPSPMLSSDGFRYFVIFVDAHTKFIWFYPMVAKSDVFNIFHQFQALVECQFSLKIKSVQTDWGGEYRKLNTYFKTIGIHHRVICPHTH